MNHLKKIAMDISNPGSSTYGFRMLIYLSQCHRAEYLMYRAVPFLVRDSCSYRSFNRGSQPRDLMAR